MPSGALMQLAAVGAQNELVNGNPSLTHFRAVYRRHTNFAMEHVRMAFSSSNLDFAPTQTRTLSCRIDRYAQMVNDCYLVLTLPDVWSPMVYLNGISPPDGYDARCKALGYEFQWISNIGYNLIDHIEITANGSVLQTLTGEFLKFYSYFTHDASKRLVVDQMVGHVKELYDPANAFDRNGQYPHSITPVATPSLMPMSKIPEPSIRARQLIVPLHFWFAENPGCALPLVALQNTEVFINVVLRPLNTLYTIIDTDPTHSTYGKRIQPLATDISKFLSPPDSTGLPTNPGLTTFTADPYLECNFIYLTEMELNQVAKADQSFLLKTVVFRNSEGQFGPNTEVEMPMHNMVTRIIFAGRRSDKELTNQWDNYTNWDNPSRAPFTAASSNIGTTLYSSGQMQITSVSPRDSVIDGVVLFNGQERFTTKPTGYFSLLQSYRFTTGTTSTKLPGVYMYSFALNHDQYQPSGAINGSMIDKVTLRTTLQQPLPSSVGISSQSVVCVLKSTVFNPNPVIIPAGQVNLLNPDGTRLYPPEDLVTVVQNSQNGTVIFTYTFDVRIYVESYNFLRIVSGLANLVFAN